MADTLKFWTMPNASESKIPFTPPMECLPVGRIPEGDAWVYELKLDGYRAQAIRDGAGVRLLSRRGKDLTKKYPFVSRDLLDAIKVGTALDGDKPNSRVTVSANR